MSQSMVSVRVSVPRVTSSAGGAATAFPIQLGAGLTKFRLRRIKLKRAAGTAANFTPFLTRAVAGVVTDIDKVWVGVATAVADLIDVTPTEACEVTDVNGFIYFVGTWDAGADNTCDIALVAEIFA